VCCAVLVARRVVTIIAQVSICVSLELARGPTSTALLPLQLFTLCSMLRFESALAFRS
jgi:hypothetical protein